MDHTFGEFLGMAVFWVFLAAVILVPAYFRHKDRQRMQDTLRLAIEKGQPIPPEVIAALQSNLTPRRPSSPDSDLRWGIILTSIGVGFWVLGYALWYGIYNESETGAYITGGSLAAAGAVPGLIGLGFLALWAMGRKSAAK